jgi:hypothetical protein
MKTFINLSSVVINKLHVTEIVKKPGKYYIYVNNSNINGKFIFSLGRITTVHNIVEICETKNKKDFNMVTDWINAI